MNMQKLPEIDRKQLGIGAFLLTMFLAILVNSAIVSSPVVGTIASVIYFILVGSLLGKVFFGDNEEGFMRFILGVFLLISLFILVGTPIVVFYELNVLGLAVVLCGPLILLTSYTFYLRLRRRNFRRNRRKAENTDDVPYFSPVYIVFSVLFAYSAFLLVESRSGWVYGTVWTVVSPSFFTAYFLAAFVLFGIILYSRTKRASKMLLLVMYSLLSTTIFAFVLYPGNFGDMFSHMAWARMIFDSGSLRGEYGLSPFILYLLVKEKGLALLTATITKMFMVDVYWVHTFITPVLWGVFIPSSAYKIAKIIGLGERTSFLAAFLTTFNSGFVAWGSRSTGNSLGFMLFFMSLYFSLWYLKSKKMKTLLLGLVTTVVSGLAHPFTGVMSLSFLFLAFALKNYHAVRGKGLRKTSVFAILPFLICVLILPFTFLLNNIVYLYYSKLPAQLISANIVEFSIQKLLETDAWALIFGDYVEYVFKDIIFSAVVPFLGIVGLAYALKERKKYSGVSISFMVLAFIICLIYYRILQYAMINPLFGPGRVWTFRDLIAIPFAALTINSIAKFLESGASKNPGKSVFTFKRWALELSARRAMAGVLIGLSLSAFAASSTYNGYTWLKGLQPTQLEVEAVRHIDEHTDGRYVVITMPGTAQIGRGFVGGNVGVWNPEKYFVYNWTLGMHPSVVDMETYMRQYRASVGYFIASSFRTPNFDEVVAEALQIFGLFKILSNQNGEIQIFQYKIPPLPVGPDVNAFYWDTPPSYIIQNDLMRVVFNPIGKNLDVKDHLGDLYESIDLNETSIDGKLLGNLTSIEYYNSLDGTWVEWDPSEEISLTEQFKFRLRFGSESLIGVVESGNPSLQLWWESGQVFTLSLQVGDFSRLYIPGLVGGGNSYNVSSREFGLLYTLSRTSNVAFHAAYNYDVAGSSLTFDQITNYCNLYVTEGYLTYDLYVENNAETDQWAYVEVWLPDVIHQGIFPPIAYSLDEKTWTEVPSSREPIKTLGGVKVSWAFTRPGNVTERPITWRTSTAADGGTPTLPENFTDSGGGQNRLLFGLYLPAGDRALVRLGASVYNVRPLKITYVFTDSDNISYGLRNMEEGLIKFYNDGYSVYVGGLASTEKPTSLAIIEDEGRIESLTVTIPSNSSIYLLSAYGVNTRIDEDNNGIPDFIEK